MKKIILIILCTFFVLITNACGENKDFTISFENKITVGETSKLNITGTEASNLVFSSSDNDVISVNDEGMIEAKSKGTAVIKAVLKKDEKVVREIAIEVLEKEKISFTVSSQIVEVGKSISFSVNVVPESAKESLEISVSPEGIIQLTGETITGLTEGKAVITAITTASKEEITIEVVKPEPILELEKTEAKIIESKETTISFESANGEVTAYSNDNNIATARIEDNKILINAISAGETIIEVKVIGKTTITKNIRVTVLENKISDFTINTSYAKKDIYSEIDINYDRNYDVIFSYEYDKTKIAIENEKIKGLVLGETELKVKEEKSGIVKTVNIMVYEYSIEAISEYVLSLYDGITIDKDIELIDEYYDSGIKIDFSMTDTTYLSNKGIFKQPVIDQTLDIIISYIFEDEEFLEFVTVTLKGWGTPFDVAFQYADEKVPEQTRRRLDLPDKCYEVDAKYVWYADGEELVDGYYSFERNEEEDYYIKLKCVIEIGNETKTREYTVRCIMLDSMEKVEKVFLKLKELYENDSIYGDIELPTEDDKYIVDITWKSYNPYVITDEGKVTKPFKDIDVEFMLTVVMGEYEKREIISSTIKGENKTEMWEKVELFLNTIHKDQIETHRFYLYGYEAGYETVLSLNIGYLPFYSMEDLKITEDILPDNSPLKPNAKRTLTKYITLHNTGMAHPSATAQGLNEYIHTTDREASWHFSVDDKEAFQELKLDEKGWHAGDSSHSYGDIYYNETYKKWSIGGGNNNSIGIEMCVYSGVDFNMVMRNTAKLTASLLVKYNLTPSDVRQHYDFAGKDCPQVLRQAGRWSEMLELISLEYYALTELQGVTFKFTSLTPEYLDNTGKIINNPDTEPTVKYQVEVTYKNETKTFVYSSVLSKKK